MKYKSLTVAFLTAFACSVAVAAGIPEPDVILYGHICIGDNPASAQDDVTVIAKATVDSQVREVGRYKMGDNTAASDCHGEDDCFVLRIRLESVPVGETASENAVVLDRANPSTVQVFLVQGQEPEQQVMELTIAQAGVIRRLNLRDTPATADFNSDGRKDLADFSILRASFQGPSVLSVASCNPADLNGDGHVDLRDFAILQAAFTGSD